jgi:hypothetical protein
MLSDTTTTLAAIIDPKIGLIDPFFGLIRRSLL